MISLKRKAFFDLDGTIIEGVSGIALARIIGELEGESGKWQEFWENQGLFENKSVPYDHAVVKLSECFAKGVKNTDTSIVKLAVRHLKKQIKIKRGFSELYSWLVENRFRIFVLTASPLEVFDAIQKFQFTETFGLVLEKNDKYTGRCVLPMTTQAKKRIIDEKNQGSIFSFGVTDSIHDLDAYEEVDVKFLLDSSCSQKKRCFVVSNFIHVKKVIDKHLRKINSNVI